MIPRTFPSSRASNGSTQMIVYFLPSVSGLTRWVDYIPVKFTTVATAATENTYNQNGYIPVVSISSIAGATPFKEYVPVFLDSSAADADVWDVTITGFIPVGTAGIGGAALYLDFAATTSLDPRITFSRTTNATVTGSNGLIQNAPMNLLTFSEQFDNAAWVVNTGSFTRTANNSVAPNSTTTADTVAATATNSILWQTYQPIVGSSYTGSVYIKRRTGTGAVEFTADGGTFTAIDLSGGGWVRATATYVATAGTKATGIRITTSGDSVDVWGAQLELGSTATTYNPTTVKNLLGFTEHFDNAAWTKSNAFVQTNLLLQSQDFDTASWQKSGVNITANSVVAPDGTLTADTFDATTGFNAVLNAGGTTVASSTTYTFSFYALRGTATALTYSVRDRTNSVDIIASVNYYSQTSSSAWARISVTFTTPATCTSVFVYPLRDSLSTGTVFLWGAQLVQGTSAGDYKATYAAAAAVGYSDIYGQPFAQKLVPDATANNHWVFQSVTTTAAPYTETVYMKAGEYSWGLIRMRDAVGDRFAWFNLATGVVGTVQANLTASITSVGNGWYRCSATIATATAGTNPIVIGPASADNTSSYTGDGTSGIYIFGAQLSDSASVDPYVYNPVAAPTSTAYYGPRFDYDPVTLAPKGLLIEEQRTNLLTYSEQFDNAVWVKSNATVAANTVVAPDGTVTADKIIPDSGAVGSFYRPTGINSSQTVTLSLYVKAAEWRYVRLQFGASFSPQPAAWFDLQAGVIVSQGGTGAQISSIGNGWFRISVTSTWLSAPDNSLYVNLSNLPSSYTSGDGTSGIYIWGAQLEAGAFATSYIPTVASQVTRAADSASMIGNNFARWYNVSEGTFFSSNDVLSVANTNPNNLVSLYTSSTNLMRFWLWEGAPTVCRFSVLNGTTQAELTSSALSANTVFKSAAAYKVDSFAASFNAAAPVTDNSGTVPTGFSALYLGNQTGSTGYMSGHIQRISYYPRRLANTELQGITA